MSSNLSSNDFKGASESASVFIELFPLNPLNDDSTILSNDPRIEDVLELDTADGENRLDLIGELLMMETSFSHSSCKLVGDCLCTFDGIESK